MNTESEPTIIIDRLREYLQLRSMKPAELARRAGVSEATISYILSGKRTHTRASNVAAIANELGVSITYLMGASDNPKPDHSELSDLLGELVRTARQLPPSRQRDLLVIARAFFLDVPPAGEGK